MKLNEHINKHSILYDLCYCNLYNYFQYHLFPMSFIKNNKENKILYIY